MSSLIAAVVARPMMNGVPYQQNSGQMMNGVPYQQISGPMSMIQPPMMADIASLGTQNVVYPPPVVECNGHSILGKEHIQRTVKRAIAFLQFYNDGYRAWGFPDYPGGPLVLLTSKFYVDDEADSPMQMAHPSNCGMSFNQYLMNPNPPAPQIYAPQQAYPSGHEPTMAPFRGMYPPHQQYDQSSSIHPPVSQQYYQPVPQQYSQTSSATGYFPQSQLPPQQNQMLPPSHQTAMARNAGMNYPATAMAPKVAASISHDLKQPYRGPRNSGPAQRGLSSFASKPAVVVSSEKRTDNPHRPKGGTRRQRKTPSNTALAPFDAAGGDLAASEVSGDDGVKDVVSSDSLPEVPRLANDIRQEGEAIFEAPDLGNQILDTSKGASIDSQPEEKGDLIDDGAVVTQDDYEPIVKSIAAASSSNEPEWQTVHGKNKKSGRSSDSSVSRIAPVQLAHVTKAEAVEQAGKVIEKDKLEEQADVSDTPQAEAKVKSKSAKPQKRTAAKDNFDDLLTSNMAAESARRAQIKAAEFDNFKTTMQLFALDLAPAVEMMEFESDLAMNSEGAVNREFSRLFVQVDFILDIWYQLLEKSTYLLRSKLDEWKGSKIADDAAYSRIYSTSESFLDISKQQWEELPGALHEIDDALRDSDHIERFMTFYSIWQVSNIPVRPSNVQDQYDQAALRQNMIYNLQLDRSAILWAINYPTLRKDETAVNYNIQEVYVAGNSSATWAVLMNELKDMLVPFLSEFYDQPFRKEKYNLRLKNGNTDANRDFNFVMLGILYFEVYSHASAVRGPLELEKAYAAWSNAAKSKGKKSKNFSKNVSQLKVKMDKEFASLTMMKEKFEMFLNIDVNEEEDYVMKQGRTYIRARFEGIKRNHAAWEEKLNQ